MKFVIGIAMFIGGYGLIYYGVSMWQAYQANLTTSGQGGMPLSMIFGFSDGSKSNGSAPPFNFSGQQIKGKFLNPSGGTGSGGSSTSPLPGALGGPVSSGPTGGTVTV